MSSKFPPSDPSSPAANPRAEPMDLNRLRRALDNIAQGRDEDEPEPAEAPLAAGAKPAATAATTVAATPATTLPSGQHLDAQELDRVFDAVCLAGSARARQWLAAFLRGLELQRTRGVFFSPSDVEAALFALRTAGRVVAVDGSQFDVTPLFRNEQLPRLLASPLLANAWKAWARAGASYGQHLDEPPMPQFRQHAEKVAYARLVMFSGLTMERYRILAQRNMGPAAAVEVLAEAVTSPFVPALFERIDATLRDALLLGTMQVLGPGQAGWLPLLNWVEADMQRPGSTASGNLRALVAERQLHLGRLADCSNALTSLSGVGVQLIQAAMLAWAGRWQEASTAFGATLKDATKTLKIKRDFAPVSLMQWFVLSLLAQKNPLAWTTAQKFCVTESGMRQPPAEHEWGLWAHAAAVRLGDAPLQTGVLDWPKSVYAPSPPDHNANRLLLAAWLGHTPSGWTLAHALYSSCVR